MVTHMKRSGQPRCRVGSHHDPVVRACVRQGSAAGADWFGHHAVCDREHGSAQRRDRDRGERHRERRRRRARRRPRNDGNARDTDNSHSVRRRAGAGTPVQNGTLVSFTTTIGRIEPSEARTSNGQVRVKFISGGQSGTATITAFSGGASGKLENLKVGSAGVERVLVSASPQTLGPGGGTSTITARVEDVSGTGLPGIPVTFYDRRRLALESRRSTTDSERQCADDVEYVARRRRSRPMSPARPRTSPSRSTRGPASPSRARRRRVGRRSRDVHGGGRRHRQHS